MHIMLETVVCVTAGLVGFITFLTAFLETGSDRSSLMVVEGQYDLRGKLTAPLWHTHTSFPRLSKCHTETAHKSLVGSYEDPP